MKITIDEKKLSDYLAEARDIYLNNIKKAAEEKGEKMPKLVEVSETISMIVFGAELRKVMFENTKTDDETPDKNDDSMTIRLDIPSCFIDHYNRDRFIESLKRIRFDIWKAYKKEIYNPCISGKYEIETLDILIDSFSNSEIVR